MRSESSVDGPHQLPDRCEANRWSMVPIDYSADANRWSMVPIDYSADANRWSMVPIDYSADATMGTTVLLSIYRPGTNGDVGDRWLGAITLSRSLVPGATTP